MNQAMILFIINQNDIEPLPEPWRTLLLILVILIVVVLPTIACVYSIHRRNVTKKRVMELGASWEEIDGMVPKPEDAVIENFEGIATITLLIFVAVVWVLWQILGPIVRDFAIIILVGAAILLVFVWCPIAMIWGVRVDEHKNAERIRLAEEYRRLKETGQDS